MLLNLLINTGSSRPSTILLTIYLYLLQVIAYPTLATKEKQTDARRGQQVQSRASQQKQRRRGQTVQAIPRTYDEIVTRATKIRYVGTSSVAIVRY